MRDDSLRRYYEARAPEYEEIYLRDDPVRQQEEGQIVSAMKKLFINRRILEIACGTGYWTRALFETARSIVAVDTSQKMLELARKNLPESLKVRFIQGDAYNLGVLPDSFDAGLANFWFSHVPRAKIELFLKGFHNRLGSGTVVFMADNILKPGIGGELITDPGNPDTYKLRKLADGSKHKVLKNYYEADQLLKIFRGRTKHLHIYLGRCFWWVSYEVT